MAEVNMKTINTFRWIAALSCMIAALGSCSKLQDNRMQDPKTVTLSATLSPKADIVTRSTMAEEGGSIITNWEIGDYVWVSYEDKEGNPLEAKGMVVSMDGSGNASISAELEDPKDGSVIMFGFPYKHWHEGLGLQEVQKGTLACINEDHSAISGWGNLNVSGGSAYLSGSVALDMVDNFIWKMKFTNGTRDFTTAIQSLVIEFEYDGYEDVYEIVPDYGLWEYYVSCYSQYNTTVKITAYTIDTYYEDAAVYTASKEDVTLEEGKFYSSPAILMTKVGE